MDEFRKRFSGSLGVSGNISVNAIIGVPKLVARMPTLIGMAPIFIGIRHLPMGCVSIHTLALLLDFVDTVADCWNMAVEWMAKGGGAVSGSAKGERQVFRKTLVGWRKHS